MQLFTYECSEQSTAECQKLSVFHTTVTYATAKLHILFEMDNQNAENKVNEHVFSSPEVIDNALNAIGLTRDALSTYQQYQYPNGDYLRFTPSKFLICTSIFSIFLFLDSSIFQFLLRKKRESRRHL